MVEVSVLGPVQVQLHGALVDLGSPKQRALVTTLTLWQGRPVPVDTIVDLLWAGTPPASVAATLQAYVSRLRTVLEPARQRREPAQVLVTVAPGYALRPAACDAEVFERLVTTGHRTLGGHVLRAAGTRAELEHARSELDSALALWRGEAYAELPDADVAAAARARLADLRLVALEDRATAALGLGEHATLAGELEALTAAHPLRERLWALRAVALVRSGRQADALAVLREIRTLLAEELGLDPSPELRELQDQVLRQDPALEWVGPPDGAPALADPVDGRAADLSRRRGPGSPDVSGTMDAADVGPGGRIDAFIAQPPIRALAATFDGSARYGADRPPAPSSGSGVPGGWESPVGVRVPADLPDAGWDQGDLAAGGSRDSNLGPEPPILGRDEELARLDDALARARGGQTVWVVLTGEPGIGKTRLTDELAESARAVGGRVIVGRCSQDEGAPPLWPWRRALAELRAETGTDPERAESADAAPDAAGTEFAAFEAIAATVRAAAGDGLLMVVLDDLHWADSATLRALRLLAETTADVQLLMVTTWRAKPQPSGGLADLAESLARRHAVRLELTGLDAAASGQVLAAVALRRPTAAQSAALHARTDGNPFFLIEYGRLAGAPTDLAALLAEENPPTAVQEVLRRRIERLPGPTVATLEAAAVIGREFDLTTLAGALGRDADEVLDEVDPALAAGLVRDDGVDRFVFEHALVSDTLYAGQSPSRRARRHARVAALLSERGDSATEQARHWLAAGPQHAARAWPAAVAGGRAARAAHGYLEAAELYGAALEAQRHDPAATARDRYDVLMERVIAHRWAADWVGLTASVQEAVEVARRIGDPELVARAAIATSQGGLWQSAPPGGVNEPIVAALRSSLAALPAGDSALRCRVLLGLANETYYVADHEERAALVARALAMADRIGDPELIMDSRQIAFVSVWHPYTREQRLAWAEESGALARRLGNEQAAVVSLALRAVVLNELGRPDQMWDAIAAAQAEAERLSIPYGLLVLHATALPWHAMAGDEAACAEDLARIQGIVSSASLQHADDAVAGAYLTMTYWFGDPAGLVRMFPAEASVLPLAATALAALCKAGEDDEARAYAAKHPVVLDPVGWFAAFNWGNAAVAALHLVDAELAEQVHVRLQPLAGQGLAAGSGNAIGPADCYLAMTAAALGLVDEARRHADRGAELTAEWGIPLFAAWFAGERTRFGF